MIKKGLTILLLLCPIAFCGQKTNSDSFPSNDIISNFKSLSNSQLLDTANYFYNKNSFDTALVFYSLLINTPVKDIDVEQQKRVIEAHNNSAVIYYYLGDYRSSYDFLIKALFLCEKYRVSAYEPLIYTNMGNIYYRFKKFDLANLYYSKALNFCPDSATLIVILNNLGHTEMERGNLDTSFFYLNKSLNISKQFDDKYLYIIFNSIAQVYQKQNKYDSALFYYQLSLEKADENSKMEHKMENLTNLGNLFFELNRLDSASYYINLSNDGAKENNFFRIMAENYHILSKIEETKGNNIKELEYFKKYAKLKDSVFNVNIFGEINQLQRLYDFSKINQQIEQLVVEQQIKERTIRYQRIIWTSTSGILFVVSIMSLLLFFQKRKLNKAYKALFEKNLESINFKENTLEINQEKYKKSGLTYDMQSELLDKILGVMDDTSKICDKDFSLDKLAETVQSNHAYVSQVINTVLKKNFSSFLNSYRIREALRLFSEPDVKKYTIEYIAFKVGFKSQSGFRDAFKAIMGVSPNFYIKSIRGKSEKF